MPLAAWMLLVLTTGFEPIVLEDHVAVLERNHFFDSEGKHVFTQWLFWDENLDLVAWRMAKCETTIDRGAMLWFDDGVFRKVKFHQYRESWTQEDPELRERERMPADLRRELRRARK